MTALSPALKARVAGIFYAFTIVVGMYGYLVAAGTPAGHAAVLVGGAAYVVVTLLLYELLAPVSRTLSLLAAFFSIVGVASGDTGFLFFGCYCVLVGYLIFKSTFLPRAVGALMAIAGLALLTDSLASILAPQFAHAISRYATGIDGLGEIALTLWLLAMGVNAEQWEKAAKLAAG